MKRLLQKLVLPIQNPKNTFQIFFNYANWGFIILNATCFFIGGYFTNFGFPPLLTAITFALAGSILYIVLLALLPFVIKLFKKFPSGFYISLLAIASLLLLAKNTVFRWPDQPFWLAALLGIILLGSLFGAIGLYLNQKKKWALLIMPISVGILGYSIFWLADQGDDSFQNNPEFAFLSENVDAAMDADILSPSENGTYSIKNLTYGSGKDFRRAEFGQEVHFLSQSVDATKLLPEWEGKKKKWREKYWRFTVDSLPINGRISMPNEDGTFPLVLFVHGNHSMTDYSDEGYKYLTDLLASKGYIAISVDENFLNGHWSGDFRGKEMPTRAWFLLKHIEQLKTWNEDYSHELKGKIDFDNIMLVGHSRGGEAVSIAAAYNDLDYYPDNALEAFYFKYGIKALVSIAPTDYRYDRKINLKNINYLSIQGSYDSDESSFWGFRPYQRLLFDDGEEYIKAAVFVDKANHGQFNSTWDRSDMGPPMSWLLNTEPILERSDQEQTAKVLIPAFAEATLKNNKQYLPIFKNAREYGSWLPNNVLLTNFQTSSFQVIADFEEDINPRTCSNDCQISANNFEIWKEEQLKTRDDESQDNNAVLLGWNYGAEMEADSIAEFKLMLSDSIPNNSQELVLSLAVGDYKMLKSLGKEQKEQSLDFSLKLTDSIGNSNVMKISEFKSIAPRLKVKYSKVKSLNQRFGKNWEVQLESFHIPLRQIISSIEANAVTEISLIFDQAKYGVIYIDDIGWQ